MGRNGYARLGIAHLRFGSPLGLFQINERKHYHSTGTVRRRFAVCSYDWRPSKELQIKPVFSAENCWMRIETLCVQKAMDFSRMRLLAWSMDLPSAVMLERFFNSIRRPIPDSSCFFFQPATPP